MGIWISRKTLQKLNQNGSQCLWAEQANWCNTAHENSEYLSNKTNKTKQGCLQYLETSKRHVRKRKTGQENGDRVEIMRVTPQKGQLWLLDQGLRLRDQRGVVGKDTGVPRDSALALS